MADYQQNFLASLGAGYNFGQQIKQQRDQSQLNQLASLAYSAPQDQRASIGSQMAALNPEAAQAQRKAWDANDERDQKELMGMARFIKAAPPEQQQNAYEKAIRPQLIARGMLAPNWTPETQGMIMQTVDALAQLGQDPTAAPSGFQAMDMQARAAGYAPGSKEYQDFFRRENGEIARASSAALKYEWVTGADGRPVLRALDPNSPTAYMATDAGTADGMLPITPASGAGQQHFGDFTSLAGEFPGVTMTSGMRTAERNQQVGGTANSQHLTGTAADYAVPQQLKPAFISRARQMGYQAIDEGDHIHLQLPRGGRAGATGAPIVGRSKEDEARAVAQAQADVELANLPTKLDMQTDAALREAGGKAAVEAGAKRQAVQAENNRAFSLYDTAMKGVSEGLGSSLTGPLAGRLPAVTAGQQIAEGGVAAIAPVLKQLFRSAGEGTFTDKDQELLLAMIPTRTDLPEARAWKIENIDRIVREKLGQPKKGGQSRPAQAQPASNDFSNLWN